MNFLFRTIITFLAIITIGLIGLMIADQQDFLAGRTQTQTVIGTGGGPIENPLSLKSDFEKGKKFIMFYIIGL